MDNGNGFKCPTATGQWKLLSGTAQTLKRTQARNRGCLIEADSLFRGRQTKQNRQKYHKQQTKKLTTKQAHTKTVNKQEETTGRLSPGNEMIRHLRVGGGTQLIYTRTDDKWDTGAGDTKGRKHLTGR